MEASSQSAGLQRRVCKGRLRCFACNIVEYESSLSNLLNYGISSRAMSTFSAENPGRGPLKKQKGDPFFRASLWHAADSPRYS
jgi:hypothetical protein